LIEGADGSEPRRQIASAAGEQKVSVSK
jgi:hypothetical protein